MGLRTETRTLIRSSRFWWLTAGVFALSRIPTWLFPFDSDHWIFYYVGRRWLDGDILYLQVWDHKAPLIFSINAAMHATLGDNIIFHRIFLTAVAVLSVWLFYKAALLIFKLLERKNPVLEARAATLLFAFWANLSQFTNSGNNTENFGVPALMAALYCYLLWRESKVWKWLLYSGVAASILVFLKINFLILLLPLIIDFVFTYRKNTWKLIAYSFIWLAPVFVQALLWLSYFMPRNLVGEFWTATVSFNGKYLRAGWAGELSGQMVFIAILTVAFLSFFGAYYFAFRKVRSEKAFLSLIAGSALLFSVILGTFYTHYYLVVMPYLCLVGAAYWRDILRSKLWLSLVAIGMIGSYGISMKQLYNRFYGPASVDARNMSIAADYVREHTGEDQKIIFYGYGATFYRLSERDSGSRYISASHPLIDDREDFGYDFTRKYIGDMAVYRPVYVVFDEATLDIYDDNEKVMDYFNDHYSLEASPEGYEIWKRAD